MLCTTFSSHFTCVTKGGVTDATDENTGPGLGVDLDLATTELSC